MIDHNPAATPTPHDDLLYPLLLTALTEGLTEYDRVDFEPLFPVEDYSSGSPTPVITYYRTIRVAFVDHEDGTRALHFSLTNREGPPWKLRIDSIAGLPGRMFETSLRTHVRASQWVDRLIALGVSTQ